MMNRRAMSALCGLLCLTMLNSAHGLSLFGRPKDDRRSEIKSQEPRHIALLLPMSGKHADAAKAIKEGFIAGYYKNDRAGLPQPSVRVYDTTSANIRQLYFKAVDEGADYVVGPLAKEDVQQLSMMSQSQMRAPILALNYHPQSRASTSFVQFSLAPEEEAAQIADRAWQKGFRTASVIVPDNDWGKRTAHAFNQQWQQHGGRIQQTVYANPTGDQSAAVRRLLGIANVPADGKPTGRAGRLPTDVIVMAAPPEQARQWKPLFDFYYAEDIPVYATSSVYSGTPNAKLDRDMNGVIFCDMPWLLDQQRAQEMQDLLRHASTEQSSQYQRLFAMGVDAYQLSRFLEGGPFHVYTGVTGNLKVDRNNTVKRQLSCAVIKDGVPQTISTFD